MNKVIFTLTVLITNLIFAQPITPNYWHNFQTFPGDYWTEAIGSINTGPEGDTGDWEIGSFANLGVSSAAKINLKLNNNNNWLISPEFDLSSGVYAITMDVAVTINNSTLPSNMGSDDYVRLLISNDNGVTWTSLYQWDTNNTPSSTGSTMPAINLSSYNSIVRFALLASNGTVTDEEDYDFFIDNFILDSATLNTETYTSIIVNHYPNPVKNKFFIQSHSPIKSISITNILGKQLATFNTNSLITKLDLENYPSGIYIISISSSKKKEIIKIIKE